MKINESFKEALKSLNKLQKEMEVLGAQGIAHALSNIIDQSIDEANGISKIAVYLNGDLVEMTYNDNLADIAKRHKAIVYRHNEKEVHLVIPE